ncbi:hypothetical protein C4J81_08300 [Deltaproteobacteria bacterium Smac51]|nr:hypothetical protein C4J81_08300 [Deltaproteobacteria bacterium Smac51]
MTTENTAPAWINDPEARLAHKNAFDGALVMGTARFNQETGRLLTKSRPFLWAIDRETGLIRSDLVRARRCPVCDEPPAQGLFVKDGFRHVRCHKCGLIYVSLILREDVIDQYWREEMAWVGVLNSTPQQELDRLKYQYGLDLVSGRLTGRRVLDIGSGPGGFVRLAEEQGWQATALELNQESSKKLAAEGYQVIVKHLEVTDLPSESYDLICLWEVLEHLPAPRMMLAEARRLLAPGGLFLILVPNVNSLVTRLLHEKSNTFGGHSHLNHFGPESLADLIGRAGLKVVEMETVITELGTINNYLSFEDPYKGTAGPVIPTLTPQLIHENMWGSRLLALAERG